MVACAGCGLEPHDNGPCPEVAAINATKPDALRDEALGGLRAVPLGPCGHTAEPYFNAEADNYYCSVCKRGMGNAYYLAAKAGRHE